MNGFLLQFRSGFSRGLGFAFALTLVFASVMLADSLHVFSAGDLVSADSINKNFEKIAPVGTILAWHKDWGATPALPDGWIECNGQTVSDSESVFNGFTTPNLNNAANAWNSKGSFLRGAAASGVMENDSLQSHDHTDSGHAHSIGAVDSLGANGGGLPDYQPGSNINMGSTYSGTANLGDPTDSGTGAGTPRHGSETRPVNMSVVWIIRIK